MNPEQSPDHEQDDRWARRQEALDASFTKILRRDAERVLNELRRQVFMLADTNPIVNRIVYMWRDGKLGTWEQAMEQLVCSLAEHNERLNETLEKQAKSLTSREMEAS